jgi:adenosylmethionine-8-amino-7-oxononanoate aminotransferase
VVALDRRHVWRPYTSSEDHEGVDPFVIVEAEGCWLVDADGRRYLDGNSSWWTASLGHRHPRLVAALKRQADQLLHCSMAGTTHEPAARLAEELVATAPPGLERVFYSDDGSTAVEVALKMAYQYWQQNGRPERTRFIALSGAFHGDTVGAMSVGGVPEFHALFGGLLFDVVRAPEPEDGDGAWERTIARIEALLGEGADRIAAVIVEPLVQGAAGMRVWPAALLSRVREATRRADTFLIADEVFTGFGRTAEMWACDHAGVTPDLLCTAKALSGGVLPFAATLATARIYDGFRGGKERALMHGHTFFGNPLGAAIAREVLAIYRDERVIPRARERAVALREGFESVGRIEGVRRVRTLGMVGAADLGAPGYYGRVGWKVHEAARARGAYIRPLGNTVYLVPPLVIGSDELARLLDILRESVAEALA